MYTTKGIAPVVIVLIIALGLGGSYAYYKGPSNVIGEIKALIAPESPDEALNAMLDTLPNIRTVQFSGEGGGPITIPDPSAIMGLSGGKTAATVTKGSGTIAWDGVVDLATSTFALSFNLARSGEKPFALAFELRMPSRDVLYARISQAPKEFEFLTGSWVSFRPSKTMSANAKENVEKALAKAANKEEKARHMTKLKEHRVLSVAEEFPKETLDGVTVRHFRIAVDQMALKAFLEDVNAHKMTPKEAAEFNEQFNKDALARTNTEIWIGASDHFPRKIVASAATKDPSPAKLTFMFKDFNKPVSVSAPAESKTFEEVLGEFLMKSFPMGNVNIKVKK